MFLFIVLIVCQDLLCTLCQLLSSVNIACWMHRVYQMNMVFWK